MARFDLRELDLVRAYHVVTRAIVPRPVALVSTRSPAGAGNLAPFSFFMAGGANPPSCVICPLNDRNGRPKDTLRNIEQTGEYVINASTRGLVEAINQASYPYEYGDDEFDRTGLTRVASEVVAPPRVAESPVALECRLHRVVPHGEGALASAYVIGEILVAHVDDALLDDDGLPDDARLDVVGRMGGGRYTHVTPATLFELPRPQRP